MLPQRNTLVWVAVLALLTLLSACVIPAVRSAPEGPAGFPATVAEAYADLSAFHVSDIPLAEFSSAGFAALGIAQPAIDLRDGASVGTALRTAFAASPRLQAMGNEATISTFMVAGLEATRGPARFTSYLSQAEVREFIATLTGRGGIGIIVGFDPLGLRILQVRSPSPASQAGLRLGDIITAANGQRLASLAQFDARLEAVSGAAGEALNLSIMRGGQAFAVTINLVQQSVNQFGTPRLMGTAAYVPLQLFDDRAAAYVSAAIRDLSNRLPRQQRLSGLILDLRGNPGGATFQARNVSDLFLPIGTPLFTIHGTSGARTHRARTPAVLPAATPIVVLIDGASASAAEIVAAALQDQGRAVVIGTRSFGKGSQQALSILPDGSAMFLTNAFVFRGTGRALSYRGVLPQVCSANVSGPAQLHAGIAANLLMRAQAISNASALNALCPQGLPRSRAEASRLRELEVRLAQALLGNSSLYRSALVR